MAIEAAAAPPGDWSGAEGGAPLYRTPLTAAAPAKPNHCPDEEEKNQNCPAAAASPRTEEAGYLYTWAPPTASYPCPAGWFCCDICQERRRTDQGKKPPTPMVIFFFRCFGVSKLCKLN